MTENISALLPERYQLRETLVLSYLDGLTRTNRRIAATIRHAFLPFTKAQVFRVTLAPETMDESWTRQDFPTAAVLKLYDRRYIDTRKDQAWSPSVEAATRRAWRDGRFDHIVDAYRYYRIERQYDGTNAVECEDYYRWVAQKAFTTEREVYRRLTPLQGRFIPRCYAAVQLDPLEEDRDVPEANVYGLMLEDVGGENLSTFDADSHDLVPSGHALLAAVSTFPSYGVLHRDIRSHNIIARPSPNLQINQLVLIDFGNASYRGGPMCPSDQDFAEALEWSDEVGALRYVLNLRHVRASSPVETTRGGHANHNHNLGLQRPTDVERWYDELPREPDDPEPNRFESKKEIFRTKPEVLKWLATRPQGLEGFYVQRPGSPLEHVVAPEWRVTPSPS